MLGGEDRAESDEWLDMVDEQIFTFKRKTHRWLKCAEEEQKKVYNVRKESIFKRFI